MRKTLLFLSLLFSTLLSAQEFVTRYETSKGTQTPTYHEIVEWWQKLDAASNKVKMLRKGSTDSGYPLHLVFVSNAGDYDVATIRKKNKRILFINNGIHPGEPDGIDASMLLARDIVTNQYRIPDNVVLAFIPVYNIDGCLNRSPNYRVDQNGPEEFGFRGNGQNFDLNRDFIKMDSRNAQSFIEIFHELDPDVFVDNHVSNGADYQHIMTLLTTQHNKLGGVLGEFLNKTFEPGLYAGMKEKGYDLIPYVNSFGDTPEKGWPEFWDSPRYGSGFGALWNTFSFVPETHMLKEYQLRVKATYALMQTFIEFTGKNADNIRDLRAAAKKIDRHTNRIPYNMEK
ncbi:MAG: M14 family metallopeptidase [Chitinophagaceae bacterium]|nr:M14 family metallopeptidase [Chitinophagaceae bacterium]